MSFGPWTRGDVLDLGILILLVIWLMLDRLNVYFGDILGYFRQRFSRDHRFYENGRRPL